MLTVTTLDNSQLFGQKKTRYESGFLFLETLKYLESFQSGNVY
jgi:hypothetical protein